MILISLYRADHEIEVYPWEGFNLLRKVPEDSALNNPSTVLKAPAKSR